MTHQEGNVHLNDLLINNKNNYSLKHHADNQTIHMPNAINTLTTATHSTVITSNNFYDQRVLTPSNNKRRIIRVLELRTVFINCQFTSGK